MTDLNNVPPELKELKQWVFWKANSKIPYNPHNNSKASVSDPKTWDTFANACKAVKDYGGKGVSFILSENDPYTAVDLDKRISEDGVIDPEAQAIIDKLDSFSEVSRSGHGIHIILRGEKPGDESQGDRIEIYDRRRQLIMTGNLWEGRGTIEDRQAELDSLYKETFGVEKPKSEPITTPIHEGDGRNIACTKEAGRLLNIYKSLEVVKPMVWAYNQAVCVPPLDEKECASTWEKSLAKWAKKESEQKAAPFKELRSFDEIEPREVEWLWKPYLPLGKVVLIEGDPGEGKSWVSLAIASRITLGEIGGPANVLIASAEDDYDDTIRPRIEEMGANIGLVYAIEEQFALGTKKGLDDQAFEMLEKHLREKAPILLIIDPLSAYLGGGVDANRANETRPVMAKLASLAREYRCTILIIRHITKGGGSKPIYRGLGSIDFTAASRSVLLAGHVDYEDGSVERALVQIKSNLAEKGASIGYILGHPFQWTNSALTASEILDQPTRGSKMDEAEILIRDMLADGEPVPANDIYKAAREAGISKRTVDSAKRKLKVKSGGKGKGEGRWHWYLPEEGENTPDLEPIVKDGHIKVNLDMI